MKSLILLPLALAKPNPETVHSEEVHIDDVVHEVPHHFKRQLATMANSISKFRCLEPTLGNDLEPTTNLEQPKHATSDHRIP
jgi:hypothetical protein